MTPFHLGDTGIYEICRGALQVGLGLLIQSTLLLAVGLMAGAKLSSRSPALRCLVYRSTLVVVATAGVLSVLFSGGLRPLWRPTLPPAHIAAAQSPPSGPLPGAPPIETSKRRVLAIHAGLVSDARSHPIFTSASWISQP